MNPIRKKIIALCGDYGIRVVWKDTESKMWCPQTKTIYRRRGSDVLHELAHFLVAKPKHRKMTNFGCGPDYEYLQTDAPKMSKSDARAEEELSSALGICFEKTLGMKYRRTMRDHGWLGRYSPDPIRFASDYEVYSHVEKAEKKYGPERDPS